VGLLQRTTAATRPSRELAPYCTRDIRLHLVRPYRDGRFRKLVMDAYAERCAVCGCSLRLVDAAHIIPVSEDGDDSVQNGVALCRLHHGAYDTALIGLLPDYRVVLNEERADWLRTNSLCHGIGEFRDALFDTVMLPPSAADHPDPGNLQRGLESRGWTLA